jgi:hypothetical protein
MGNNKKRKRNSDTIERKRKTEQKKLTKEFFLI